MGSLARGLEILEYVAENQAQGVSYPQILSYTGFPQSSCFRLLKELVSLNYLTYNEESRRYFVSMKVAGIGNAVANENSLSRILHPFLEKLRDESKQTCNLGVMNNESGMFLDVLYSKGNAIKLLSRVGGPFPLHCTALGKVLLAYASEERRQAILSSPLEALTPRSVPNRAYLEQQLEQVLEAGYATEHEESTLGIHCFAAPIFDYKCANIAAVSIACPYFDFEKPGEPERLINIVCHYAQAMSAAMGYKKLA